jgi:hypothetical protein
MLCVIHSRIELEMIHHPSRAQLSLGLFLPFYSLVVSLFFPSFPFFLRFQNVFRGVVVLIRCAPCGIPGLKLGMDLIYSSFFSFPPIYYIIISSSFFHKERR